MRQALCLQSGWPVLAALILNGGLIFTACWYASVGFWFGVILLPVRRPVAPTINDLLYFRFGLPVMLLTAIPLFAWFCQNKGAT